MSFLIIIPIVLLNINYLYKRTVIKGKRGENKVSFIIGDTVENEQYVINNLT